MTREIEYNEDAKCECGSTYGEHYSDLEGDDWCPLDDERQKFSPFAYLWPLNDWIN